MDFVYYTYNSDGIRTKKYEYNGNDMYSYTHNYVLDGAKILKETVTNQEDNSTYTLYYLYDANGSITGLHYNGSPYYFQKSIQGGRPGEAEQDAEGMQSMRTPASNMAFLMKSSALGKEKYGLPEKEQQTMTSL